MAVPRTLTAPAPPDRRRAASRARRAWRLEGGGSHLVGQGPEEALLITDHSTRSQADNREACLTRLKTLVSMAAKKPKVRRKTKPTRGSVERRIESKKREGEKKRDRRWEV